MAYTEPNKELNYHCFTVNGQLLSSFIDATLNNLEGYKIIGPITFEINTEAGTISFSVMPK